ncbi:MAG TPA: 2-C-methyl-D-erythritol 4-phosphate cytidylyltransferase [Spirochaetes bacterium]|nr:2-C-methyl-D-erythritol 4-phosphate cytidylyltransferase [Spirochaetota bacterium]
MMEEDSKRLLILAAGQSSRMGSLGQKQFLELQGLPIFLWSIKTALALSSNYSLTIVLVHSVGDREKYKDSLIKNLDSSSLPSISLVEGGASRSQSVYNGLQSISHDAEPNDSIIIHDSARPFLGVQDLLKVIDSLKHYSAVTLSYPVTNTIKLLKADTQEIQAHLKRDDLRAILTPQGFRFSVLWKAYREFIRSPYPVTDDTEIVAKMGHPIQCIDGKKSNIKITNPEDLLYAEFYCQKYNLKPSEKP